MAEGEVAISLEQEGEGDMAISLEQWEVVADESVADEPLTDESEESGDGSDHTKALADLKSKLGEKKTFASSSSSKLQCPKVPERLRSYVEGAEDNYAPKLISLGPYHNGKSNLVAGETLKLKLATRYLQFFQDIDKGSVEEAVVRIHRKVRGKIKKLRGCYDPESTKKYSDAEFTVMMLVDGCALLSYVLCVCLGADRENCNIRYQDLSRIHQDALLLENQLPYELLHDLMKMVDPELADAFWTVMFQKFVGLSDKSFFEEFFDIKEKSFLRKMKDYCCGLFLANKLKGDNDLKTTDNEQSNNCHHLLHLFRRNFLGDEGSSPMPTANEKSRITVSDVKEQIMASFRNVKELMTAGIGIKPSRTLYISFTSNGITACLRLPPITIDKSTKARFLNLIAYEMSSDIPHYFISYLHFLDSLIDHADDVKELQSIGILQNNLGTHEEVAQFFNTLSANLESNFEAYKDVRVKIRKHLQSHYSSKPKTWMTQCLDSYFSSPWTIIAWVGAALALFLTAVQTYFSVFHH